MKYMKLFLSICVWCLFSLNLFSQIKCTNKVYFDLVEQIPEINSNENFTGDILIPSISKDKPVTVKRNSNRVVNHIGIKFFDDCIREKHPSPIYNFIERYFLELLLLPNQKDIETKLKMERVSIKSEVYSLVDIKKGLKDIISGVSTNLSVYITCNNNRYTASCMANNRLLVKFSFPVRYELITGFSKIEAENSIFDALLLHKIKENQPLSSDYMSTYKNGMYCANEDYYVKEDIISTSFYTKKGNDYIPVYSLSHLEESVYNLFNVCQDRGIEAEVELNLYGGKKNTFSIPLVKLTSFMLSNQCSLYTGIRKYDKTNIEGVMIGVNMELGYQHIVMFSFNKQVFDAPESHKVSVKLYSYVPIHNISTLF